jgi:hypothetical protein
MISLKIGAIAVVVVSLAALTVVVLRRGSNLPPHLKPYFKNKAALDTSVKRQQAANAKRREELTNPTNTQEAAEYLSLQGYDVVVSATFEKALQMVEVGLKDNPCDYGQLLGETYAFTKAYRNPEKAYYYYHVGLSQDGYTVGFQDQNYDPPYYCGPVGDFRNEPQVSELVVELGWDKIKGIDLKAREWLTQNKFQVQEFRNEQQAPGHLSTATE